jgi:hypothetical protein
LVQFAQDIPTCEKSARVTLTAVTSDTSSLSKDVIALEKSLEPLESTDTFVLSMQVRSLSLSLSLIVLFENPLFSPCFTVVAFQMEK